MRAEDEVGAARERRKRRRLQRIRRVYPEATECINYLLTQPELSERARDAGGRGMAQARLWSREQWCRRRREQQRRAGPQQEASSHLCASDTSWGGG